jgi:probable phosphoglycerate mutase
VAIYLIRHGETVWALDHRHTGGTDIALTSRGEEQARELSHRLAGVQFDRVLSSPMQRAYRTAELSGVSPRAEITPLLCEFDYGDYEGITSAEIERSSPGWDLWRDGCPNGESAEQVARRSRQLLDDLHPRPGRNYALFAHGHVLRAVAAVYLGLPLDLCRHLIVKVASISVLGEERGIPAIELWDLPEALKPAVVWRAADLPDPNRAAARRSPGPLRSRTRGRPAAPGGEPAGPIED